MGCNYAMKGDYEIKLSSEIPIAYESILLPTQVDAIIAYNEDKLILGGRGQLLSFSIESKQFEIITQNFQGSINCIIKLLNGLIVTAGQEKIIKVWDIMKKELVESFYGHTSIIWSIAELNDGKIISGSDDKNVMIWDLSKKTEDYTLMKGDREISSVLQLKNNNVLIGCGEQLMLYDLIKKSKINEITIRSGVWAIKQINDEQAVAGLGNGKVVLLKVNNESISIETYFSSFHKKSVCFLIELGNKEIITGGDDNELVIYNPNNKNYSHVLYGHNGIITGLAFINNLQFASVSEDKVLKIWT